MFENLFQDLDTGMKKSIKILKVIYCLVKSIIVPEPKKTITPLHDGNIFLTKWPGWWLGADEFLNEDVEIKCPSLHFENTMFET